MFITIINVHTKVYDSLKTQTLRYQLQILDVTCSHAVRGPRSMMYVKF